jgi:hypothetical protein
VALATPAVVVAFVGFGPPHAAEHVVVDSDPGVYLVTGRWLAEHGTLTVPPPEEPFGTLGLGTGFAGLNESDDKSLTFQFGHLLAVALALGYAAGGDALMVRVPLALVAIGLLAVHAVSARLARAPWAGTLATVTVALCLPVVVTSRDTFSETLVLALVWLAAWLWTVAWDAGHRGTAVVGGVVFGMGVAARIDDLALLVALPPVLALLTWGARSRRVQRASVPLLFAGAAAPGVVLGAVDLAVRSPDYLASQADRVGALCVAISAAAALAIIGVTVVGRRGPRIGEGLGDGQPGGSAWLATTPTAASLPPPPLRRPPGSAPCSPYVPAFPSPTAPTARSSPPSSAWKASPSIRAGSTPSRRRCGSPGTSACRWGRRRGRRRTARAPGRPRRGGAAAVPVAALGTAALLYLWRPSITPYQLWASRRLVPASPPWAGGVCGASWSSR